MSVGEGKALLEIEGLRVRRGEVAAVDGVSLTVEEHSFFVLVGPSGCGKTSLLRAIAGFERPEEGTIRLAGEVLAGPSDWQPPERRQVGMVFQDGALFPHLTVAGNVSYGLAGRPNPASRTEEVLELVGLSGHLSRYPDELSGGERQRVALARALAPSPRLLLLDEPFANLDAGLRRRVREEIRAIIAEAGATAILVTHDQEEALSLADRLAIMVSARILQEGRPEFVYCDPASLEVSSFLGTGQLLPCEVDGGRARFVLGEADTECGDGLAWVLVRPEQLTLTRGGAGSGGRVCERHFYGHDLVEVVELESGDRIQVRLQPGEDVPVGERVQVSLAAESLSVFPRR